MKQTLTIVADSITEAYDMVRSYNETLRLNNNAVWPLNAEWTVTHIKNIKKDAQWAVTLYCIRDDEFDAPPVVKHGGYGYNEKLTYPDLEKRCNWVVAYNTELVKDNSELTERIETAMKRQHCLVTARDNAVDNARKIADDFARAEVKYKQETKALESDVNYWRNCARKEAASSSNLHKLLVEEQKKYNDVREELKDFKLKHIELFKDWNKQGRDMMDLMQTHCEMSKLIDMCVPFGYTPGQDFEAFRSWLYKQFNCYTNN